MRKLAGLILISASFFLIQCSDNPVDTDGGITGNPAAADSIAGIYFEALGDTMDALSGRPEEQLRNARFDDLRAGFQQARAEDGANGLAHLGLAIVEILELNYSQQLWALLDELSGTTPPSPPTPATLSDDGPYPRTPPSARHHALVGRQFQLVVEIPFAVHARAIAGFPDITLAEIQTVIVDVVIPALGRAIGHLDVVEARTGTRLRFKIKDNGVEEYVVIDLGEILVFSASIHALRAAFYEGVAYDFDFLGPDGTYAWMDDYNQLYPCFDDFGLCWDRYEVIPRTPYDDYNLFRELRCTRVDALRDSILTRVLHHNVANRPQFAALRDNGDAMRRAGEDLRGTLSRLEGAADFIRNRGNETAENVIKLADLTDLDAGLNDPNAPNFAQGWTKIEDVFAFVRSLITGPVAFDEEIGPRDTPYQWTMDLSVWFDSPQQDFVELLPYHRWVLPTGAWLKTTTWQAFQQDYSGASPWYEICAGSPIQLTNAGLVTGYGTKHELVFDAPFVLTTETGDSLTAQDPMPHFPDYTLNGMFPGMDRNAWIDLLGILR